MKEVIGTCNSQGMMSFGFQVCTAERSCRDFTLVYDILNNILLIKRNSSQSLNSRGTEED